ncbi:MAG: tyrosine-type recombinase/integrase, partial [Sedimentisphaerales bacterium]
MLYRLAAESGIRKNELRSLTVSSFDLPGHSVTVSAGDSKHRQEDRLPLRPDTADALAGFLCGKMPTVKVFNIPGKTAKML